MLKFGILGAAPLCVKVLIEPSKRTNGAVIVRGIAARDQSKAEEFAKKFSIDLVYPNYQSLIKDKDIDAVYIPLATNQHAFWTIEAIKNNKHVLVEKPICISLDDIKQIKLIRNLHKTVVLEALMTQQHPCNNKIKEIVKSGKYGKAQKLETYINFPFTNEEYLKSFSEKGGGVFIHEAPYWSQFLQNFTNTPPILIKGTSSFNKRLGLETDFLATLTYNENFETTFKCSWRDPLKNNHVVTFENHLLYVSKFIKPALIQKSGLSIKVFHKNGELVDVVKFEDQNYYDNQLKCFLELIKNGNDHQLLEESFDRIRLVNMILDNTTRIYND